MCENSCINRQLPSTKLSWQNNKLPLGCRGPKHTEVVYSSKSFLFVSLSEPVGKTVGFLWRNKAGGFGWSRYELCEKENKHIPCCQKRRVVFLFSNSVCQWAGLPVEIWFHRACQRYPCTLGKSNTIEYESANVFFPPNAGSSAEKCKKWQWSENFTETSGVKKLTQKKASEVKEGTFVQNLPFLFCQATGSSQWEQLVTLDSLLYFGALLFSVIFLRGLTV